MNKTVKNYVLPVLVISALCTAVMFSLYHYKVFEGLEVKVLDWRFQQRGERPLKHKEDKDRARVVAIDTDTIEIVGRWPWPRGVLGNLVHGLCDPGALEEDWDSTDGWDDIEEDSEGEDDAAVEESEDEITDDEDVEEMNDDDDEFIEDEDFETLNDEDEDVEIATDEDGEEVEDEEVIDDDEEIDEEEVVSDEDEEDYEVVDDEEFEEFEDYEEEGEDPLEKETASRTNNNVIGVDVLFDRQERPYEEYLLEQMNMLPPAEHDRMATEAFKSCNRVTHISLMKFPDTEGTEWETELTRQVKYKTPEGEEMDYLMPRKSFSDELPNTRMGFANMLVSPHDDRVRKAQVFYKAKDRNGKEKIFYAFAIQNLAAYQGIDEKDIHFDKQGRLVVGKYKIPVNDEGEIWINYTGREPKNKLNTALQFMTHVNDETTENIANKWKDTIMLVGVTDQEIKDIFYTPLGIISGIEVHKAIIDTVLQEEYLFDAPMGKVVAFILLGAIIVSLCTLLKLWAGVLSLFVYGGAFFYYGLTTFIKGGEILPVFPTLVALPLCLAASMLYRNLVVDREKNQVKNIFKSYVAPHVLAELMDDPKDLKLGGKKSKVSVLFSDIRSFTTISEQLDPDVLIQGLNHYLETMTQLVLDNSGMIDKFIGDAVMAIWGAPVPHEEDAKKAVTAAVKMEDALNRINPHIKELTGMTFAIGVGINTGDATLGNIGSAGKLDYTVIGDAVNLASRLEGLTKQYGAFLVISEFTYEEIKDHFECRYLDDVMVKGKDKPVGVYQVLCEKGAMSADMQKLVEHFHKGRELYKARKFEEAVAEFNKGLEISPDDKACKLYTEERCPHYKENPPPEDWDGAFKMTTK